MNRLKGYCSETVTNESVRLFVSILVMIFYCSTEDRMLISFDYFDCFFGSRIHPLMLCLQGHDIVLNEKPKHLLTEMYNE